ncbi:MAG TPA: VOC family protein [Bacteroidia bacterium]|nr:VOC family protein [Bacteroidia bacterium]
MTTINPFLHYNGNCLEAFEHYKKAFGGEFHMMSRYKDMPGANPEASGGDRLMHIALPIGDRMHLQGSDFPESMGSPVIGNNLAVVVNTTDEADTRRIYGILSEGGQITMPLAPTFWTPLFGMCIDKFGISWMVSLASMD